MRPGQFLQSGIVGLEREEGLKNLSKLLPVSVALFRPDYSDNEDLLQLIHRINRIYKVESGLPEPYIAVDQEGGNVVRLPWTNYSPGNYQLGRIDDVQFSEFTGMMTGHDLYERGIRWDLAPVLDILNSYNPVLMERSFGEDAELVARHGEAFIRGLQKFGVAGTAKHFPGHGGVIEDSHLTLPRDKRPRNMVLNDAYPFRKAIREGVKSIMLAHILYESIDSDFPASMSAKIQSMARSDFGFNGVLVTDSVDMKAITNNYSMEEIVKYSLGNNVDVLECVQFQQTLEMADYVLKIDSDVLKRKLRNLENFLPDRTVKFKPPEAVMDAMSTLSGRVLRDKKLDPSKKIRMVFLDTKAESVASDRLSSGDRIVGSLRETGLDVEGENFEDFQKFRGKNEQLILIGRNEHIKDRSLVIAEKAAGNEVVYVSTSVAKDMGSLPESMGYIAAYSVKPENILGAIYRAVGFL